MITYWQEDVGDGYPIYHLEGTKFGDLTIPSESLVPARVKMFGIVYLGITTDPITVKYPDGQPFTFREHTNDPEIVRAIKRFLDRGPNDPIPDNRSAKGGPGSGNFGHTGRPGSEGGSVGRGASGLRYTPDPLRRTRSINLGTKALLAEGIDPESVLDSLREYGKQGEVTVRVPEGVVDKILESGSLKSQFETGTSKGLLNLSMRREAEENGLGIPRDTENSERPIYGYLRFGSNEGSETQYGHVQLILKDTVKDRSTMTIGDSLGQFQYDTVVGTPIRNPGLEVVGYIDNTTYIKNARDRGVELYHNDSGLGYIETQIQGGVKLSDIDRVYDPFSNLSSAHIEGFKSRGIDVTVGYDFDELLRTGAVGTGESGKGGPGSGNFGHAGRPGSEGGSVGGGSGLVGRTSARGEALKEKQRLRRERASKVYLSSTGNDDISAQLQSARSMGPNDLPIVSHYVIDSGYFNRDLRQDFVAPEHTYTGKDIRNLDRITESNTVPLDIQVFRGVHNADFIPEVSKTFADLAYVSTTLKEEYCHRFAKTRVGESPAILRIKVDAGLKGIYLEGLPSKYPGEYELLLPRRSMFRVDAKTVGEDGIPTYDLTYLGQ